MNERKRFKRVLVNRGRDDAAYWQSPHGMKPETWRDYLTIEGVEVESITPISLEQPRGSLLVFDFKEQAA